MVPTGSRVVGTPAKLSGKLGRHVSQAKHSIIRGSRNMTMWYSCTVADGYSKKNYNNPKQEYYTEERKT